MNRKAFVSTSFCGTVTTATVDLDDSTRNFIRLLTKKHQKEFPHTKSFEVIACINLTKIRVLRSDLKLKGQVQNGCFVWLVNNTEWESFANHLNSAHGTPTRYGRSLPYRSPSSLSPRQLHDFVKCFCDCNKLNMNTDAVDEVMNKHKALLSPNSKTTSARGLPPSVARKKPPRMELQSITETNRKVRSVDEDKPHSRDDDPSFTDTQLEEKDGVCSSNSTLVPSVNAMGVNESNVKSSEIYTPSHPLSHVDDSVNSSVETNDAVQKISNDSGEDNEQSPNNVDEEEKNSRDEDTCEVSNESCGDIEVTGKLLSVSAGSTAQPDSSLVLKMFSDMERLESAIAPALSKQLEDEHPISAVVPGDEKKSDESSEKSRKLRKQEEFKKEVLNLKAAIQQMKTGQNEMKSFLSEINSMNDNLNAVRDMIKLQEFQKRLQAAKHSAKVSKNVQPAHQPPPEATQQHATAFNGVMKSILSNPMLNASLKESPSSQVTPQKKNSNLKRTTSAPAKTTPGSGKALMLGEAVVGGVKRDDELVPPPPQVYSPFRVIEKKLVSFPSHDDVDKHDCVSIVHNMQIESDIGKVDDRASSKDDIHVGTVSDIEESKRVNESDSDSDSSDILSPPSQLMMSPSRIHQAILFESSPLQKEGFEQVEARIAAEEERKDQGEEHKLAGVVEKELSPDEQNFCSHLGENVSLKDSTKLECDVNLCEKGMGDFAECQEANAVDINHRKVEMNMKDENFDKTLESLQKPQEESVREIFHARHTNSNCNNVDEQEAVDDQKQNTSVAEYKELSGSVVVQEKVMQNCLEEISNVKLSSTMVTDENHAEEVANVELTSTIVEELVDSVLGSESGADSGGGIECEKKQDKPEEEANENNHSCSSETHGVNSSTNKFLLKHQLSLQLQATRETLTHVEGAPVLPSLEINYDVEESHDFNDNDNNRGVIEAHLPVHNTRPAVLKHQLSRQLQATRRSLNHVEGALPLPPIDPRYSDSEDEEIVDENFISGAPDEGTHKCNDASEDNRGNRNNVQADTTTTSTSIVDMESPQSPKSEKDDANCAVMSNNDILNRKEFSIANADVEESTKENSSSLRPSAYKSLFGAVTDEDEIPEHDDEHTSGNYLGDDEDDDENERDDIFISELGAEPTKLQHYAQPDARNDFHKINILIALYSPYFYITECPHKRTPFRETPFKASESTTCLLWAIFQCYTKNESDVISRSMKVTYLLHMLRDAGLLQPALSSSAPVMDTTGNHNQQNSKTLMRRDSMTRKNCALDSGPLDWSNAKKDSVYGSLTPTTSNRIALELERLNKLDSTIHASSGNAVASASLNSSVSSSTSKVSVNNLTTHKPSLEHVVSTSSNVSFVVFTELMFSLTNLCFPDFEINSEEDCPIRHSWKYDDFLRLHFLTPYHQIPSGFFDLPSTQILGRLAHLLLVGSAGVNSMGAPAYLPSGMFTSPFPRYTPADARRIFVEKGYNEVDAAILSTPFQEDSVFAIPLDGFQGRSGLGMYGLWEHNIEQMKSVYTFYAHGVTSSRRESMTANSMKTAQSAIQKSRNAIDVATVSTSKPLDSSMLDFEKIKTFLQNFQIYPKHVDLKTVQALFQYTKQWEWTWAENKLSLESPASSSEGPPAIRSPLKQNRRNVRASISFLALERDPSLETNGVPNGRQASKMQVEKSAIPITSKELKKCEASTLMTFRGFIEFLTRLSLYIHVHNLEHNSQSRQRGNMKAREGGSSREMQYQLKMEVLGTAIGFLLRLMDNSTGKKIIMGASRRGSVAIKNFIYK